MKNSHIPPHILAALLHVKSFHPSVDTVSFDLEARWTFSDGKKDIPNFSKKINVDILEDTIYDIKKLPCSFHLDNE